MSTQSRSVTQKAEDSADLTKEFIPEKTGRRFVKLQHAFIGEGLTTP